MALRVTLRGARILPLYESLLFEKEEYFHSTSHYSSREKNTSTSRVTLREGEYFHSTSHLLASKTRTSMGVRLRPRCFSRLAGDLLRFFFPNSHEPLLIGKPTAGIPNPDINGR